MQGKCCICTGYITGKRNPLKSKVMHNGCGRDVEQAERVIDAVKARGY